MIDLSGQKVEIQDAVVLSMQYLADFGRVEGTIQLTLKRSNAPFSEHSVILTSVAMHAGEAIEDAKKRLVNDAVRLWHLTEQPGVVVPDQEYELQQAA